MNATAADANRERWSSDPCSCPCNPVNGDEWGAPLPGLHNHSGKELSRNASHHRSEAVWLDRCLGWLSVYWGMQCNALRQWNHGNIWKLSWNHLYVIKMWYSWWYSKAFQNALCTSSKAFHTSTQTSVQCKSLHSDLVLLPPPTHSPFLQLI